MNGRLGDDFIDGDPPPSTDSNPKADIRTGGGGNDAFSNCEVTV